MDKDDPLNSAKYSVEHAKNRFAELERDVVEFMNGRPFLPVNEEDAETGIHTFKVRLIRDVPRFLPAQAFDVLNILRASLDQAAYACACAINPDVKKRHAFPFGDMAKSKNPSKTNAGSLPENIFDLMASFRPYRGGDEVLYAINQLANTQKHKLIVPHVGKVQSVTIVGGGLNSMHYIEKFSWDHEKNEIIVSRWKVLPGSRRSRPHIRYKAFLAFDDVADPLSARPAAEVLGEMIEKASAIIDAVEAEAIKSGLF